MQPWRLEYPVKRLVGTDRKRVLCPAELAPSFLKRAREEERRRKVAIRIAHTKAKEQWSETFIAKTPHIVLSRRFNEGRAGRDQGM
jgi:hypothetical protein